ncbi:hypothetical protein GBF38_000854 [Nibea albiflora]|nr:hypothetical protein GBF38_000854 [Nibea albiflora]
MPAGLKASLCVSRRSENTATQETSGADKHNDHRTHESGDMIAILHTAILRNQLHTTTTTETNMPLNSSLASKNYDYDYDSLQPYFYYDKRGGGFLPSAASASGTE